MEFSFVCFVCGCSGLTSSKTFVQEAGHVCISTYVSELVSFSHSKSAVVYSVLCNMGGSQDSPGGESMLLHTFAACMHQLQAL